MRAADGGGGMFALLRTGDVRAFLTRYSDLALAAVVVAIVGMMIVPLPTPLLDLLISVNIATAVVLLLVAIYVSDALKIATFPTLLLLTTLFRLALEVSATWLMRLCRLRETTITGFCTARSSGGRHTRLSARTPISMSATSTIRCNFWSCRQVSGYAVD